MRVTVQEQRAPASSKPVASPNTTLPSGNSTQPPAADGAVSATSSRAIITNARKAERHLKERIGELENSLEDARLGERNAKGRCSGLMDALRRATSDKRAALEDVEALQQRVTVQKRSVASLQSRLAMLEHLVAKVF
jgi:chromosome segregation ATPase